MNKTSFTTSAVGIALLLATAVPAFAEDNGTAGSDDTSVTSSTGVTTTHDQDDDRGGDRKGLLGLPKLRTMASSTIRIERKEDREQEHLLKKASTSEQRIEKGQEKAGDMIDRRIKSLQELKARLAGKKLLPADALAAITASIDTEIQILTDLRTKISNDTDAATLKADASSITKANRVYMLVMPKAQIAAAGARINAVVTQFQSLSTKLQERITTAQTAGVDVTAATAALADFNAKIADAKVQADAAVTMTANLPVDNGDAAVIASNKAALQAAHAKLKTAEADLKAARDDAKTIAGIVKGKGGTP